MPSKVRRIKKLSGEELVRLANKMVEAKTDKEAKKLRIQITEGFYGEMIQEIRRREKKRLRLEKAASHNTQQTKGRGSA